MLGLYLDTLIIGTKMQCVEYSKWINIANGLTKLCAKKYYKKEQKNQM